jgi:hypothetical protein
LLAAKALGLATVPVHIARDLSPEQIKAYRLADNRTGEEADWDDDLLKLEIGDLDIAGFDLRLTGFDDGELVRIRLTGNEGLTDPDDIPEPPANPVTRLGDCWLLGSHRLICGDSTDGVTVEKALAGTSPHLMVTDPPYGVEYDASWRRRAGINSPTVAIGKVLNDSRADWRDAWALFPATSPTFGTRACSPVRSPRAWRPPIL